MTSHVRLALLSALLLGVASCGEPSASATGSNAAPATPKAAIAQQLEQIKAGDVAGLKANMTERVRDKVTPEVVDKAKEQAAKMTIDDLVASVEDGMDGANKTAKITMKNGRTLTTLVQVDGRWLADTIWFK